MPLTRLLPSLLCLALLAASHAGDAGDIAASLQRGRADDALKAADKALASSPRDARLRLLRGNALAQLGRTAEAIQVFTALTSDHPNLPEPYNNLATIYAQQGQLDKARAALQMALQTNPAYATAHANLADVYARLAAQAYDKALQRDVVERQARPQDAPPTQPAPKLALVPDLLSRTAPANSRPVVLAQAPTPAPTPAPAPSPTPKPAAASKPVVVAAAPSPTPAPAASKPAMQPVTTAPAPAAQPGKAPAPTPTPAPAADKNKDAEAQVGKAVIAWADAWADKRVPAYLASYSRQYKPAGMSRSDWEKQRRQRIESAKKISVKVGKLRIKIDGKKATARFVQQYSSDKTDKSTVKTLILEKNGDRWLISEERVG